MRFLLFVLLLNGTKFNAVFSQPLSFSVTPSANLGLIYENESDFEVERIIPNAIEINLSGRNRQLLVSARTLALLNFSIVTLPPTLFSLKLNSTNAVLGPEFYQKIRLNTLNQNVLLYRPRNQRNFWFFYDLVFDPITLEHEPGQYHYSIIFTLTEL